MDVAAAIASQEEIDRRLRLLQRTVDVAALERRAAELRERQQAGEALGLVDTIDAHDPYAGPIYLLSEILEVRGMTFQAGSAIASPFFNDLSPSEPLN